MNFLTVIFKRVLYIGFLVCTVLLLLELAYRYQLVEFFSPQLSALNKENEKTLLSDSRRKVLVIGDSFSASANNYVDHLRVANPDYRFLNASVPGTGIRQQKIIMRKRIRSFQPDLLIYQFYVGNDLTDIIHPWNSSAISFWRSVYWRLSEHLLILPYINSRLSFLRINNGTADVQSVSDMEFSADTYNSRTKMYIQAKSDSYCNSILLKGDMLKSYNIWSNYFNDLVENLPPSCKVYVLVIPHCLQTSKYYLRNFGELGAEVSSGLLENDYPLINRMRKDHSDVIFLNPLSHFQQSPSVDSIYYSVDPHLNQYGQKVLTDFIQEMVF